VVVEEVMVGLQLNQENLVVQVAEVQDLDNLPEQVHNLVKVVIQEHTDLEIQVVVQIVTLAVAAVVLVVQVPQVIVVTALQEVQVEHTIFQVQR
jgi:hypothetical protein